MISITIGRRSGTYRSINCLGHADYAKAGDDIVCAAASILVINTINAIDSLTDDQITVGHDQKDGRIDAVLGDGISERSELLIDAMVMGLKEIERQYGRRYITLVIKED